MLRFKSLAPTSKIFIAVLGCLTPKLRTALCYMVKPHSDLTPRQGGKSVCFCLGFVHLSLCWEAAWWGYHRWACWEQGCNCGAMREQLEHPMQHRQEKRQSPAMWAILCRAYSPPTLTGEQHSWTEQPERPGRVCRSHSAHLARLPHRRSVGKCLPNGMKVTVYRFDCLQH